MAKYMCKFLILHKMTNDFRKSIQCVGCHQSFNSGWEQQGLKLCKMWMKVRVNYLQKTEIRVNQQKIRSDIVCMEASGMLTKH